MRNRLIGVALGILIAAAIIAWQSRHHATASWPTLSESNGAITAVALQYTHASAPLSNPAYQAFLAQLPDTVEVFAACPNTADAAEFRSLIAAWRVARPERVHTVVVNAQITGWCKDRFLVASGQPETLIEPPPILNGPAGRSGDSQVAGAFAAAFPTRFKAVETTLNFDSGDILCTRTRVIVSDVLFDKNQRDPRFAERLKALFGRQLVWLHNVPPHHIGMFCAPLDDDSVLVGDPALMRPLWTADDDKLLGRADFSPAIEQLYQNAQTQLRAAGFRVIAVPEAYLAPQVYISYTNGVFENAGEGQKTVYMPSYGIPALDAAATAAYQREGWTVKPIPVRSLYKLRGTIGCLINVVGRG